MKSRRIRLLLSLIERNIVQIEEKVVNRGKHLKLALEFSKFYSSHVGKVRRQMLMKKDK